MLQAIHHTRHDASDLLFSSWDAGWRSLLLHHRRGDRIAEQVELPPIDAQVIVLVIRGACTIESRSGGRWHSAHYHQGSLGFTAPHQPSHLRWTTDAAALHETLHLWIPESTFARVMEEDFHQHMTSQLPLPDALQATDPLLEVMLLRLFRANRDGVTDLYAESAARFLAVHLLVHLGHLRLPQLPRPNDQRIHHVQDWIRQNLHEQFPLAAMADEARLSPFHFLRVFAAQTGETPYRYLMRVRIRQAQCHLQESTWSIGHIATSCGFTTAAHFSTAFRRHIGMTPTAYRQQFQR